MLTEEEDVEIHALVKRGWSISEIARELRGRHRHPVPDRGDAKQLELVRLARLGYMHPPQRLRPICLGPQFVGEFVEERSHTGDPLSGDDIYRDAIDTRGPGIGSHG